MNFWLFKIDTRVSWVITPFTRFNSSVLFLDVIEGQLNAILNLFQQLETHFEVQYFRFIFTVFYLDLLIAIAIKLFVVEIKWKAKTKF